MKFILSPREACALKIGSLKMAFSPFLNLLEATTLSIFLEVASICLSLCNKLPKCVKSYITALFSEDWGFWGFDWLNNKNWFNRRTLCRVDLLLALSWVCLIIEISKVAGQYLLLSAAEWSPSTLSIGCVEFSKQKREEENSSIVDCIRATKPLSINES